MSLLVKIYSLSLKQNSPLKDAEHGYSYIFDLRCLPNPGREANFKTLSGKDHEVVEYLEKIPEVHKYYQNAKSLIDLSINEYLNRNFSLLSIGFGCTGGQHRSVYFAERLRAYLLTNPKLTVNIEHLNLKL